MPFTYETEAQPPASVKSPVLPNGLVLEVGCEIRKRVVAGVVVVLILSDERTHCENRVGVDGVIDGRSNIEADDL